MAEEFVIEMLHITKEFPGIKANDDITLQPVSYTHLDVYKRQPLGPIKKRRLFLCR